MPPSSEQEFTRAISDLCFYAKKSGCSKGDINQLEQILRCTLFEGVWERLASVTNAKGLGYQQILLNQALHFRTIATSQFLRQQKCPLYLVSAQQHSLKPVFSLTQCPLQRERVRRLVQTLASQVFIIFL